jgi:Flp pilus assembly protein protease CpaA
MNDPKMLRVRVVALYAYIGIGASYMVQMAALLVRHGHHPVLWFMLAVTAATTVHGLVRLLRGRGRCR